eukprot:Seg1525.2 transcript_id=Seg1525.2/GoldUCD/mRNA.D3Y31 product="hypothetical protein" protein_id=Seg1525.2/GoldUCD/D3Y31
MDPIKLLTVLMIQHKKSIYIYIYFKGEEDQAQVWRKQNQSSDDLKASIRPLGVTRVLPDCLLKTLFH